MMVDDGRTCFQWTRREVTWDDIPPSLYPSILLSIKSTPQSWFYLSVYILATLDSQQHPSITFYIHYWLLLSWAMSSNLPSSSKKRKKRPTAELIGMVLIYHIKLCNAAHKLIHTLLASKAFPFTLFQTSRISIDENGFPLKICLGVKSLVIFSF